MRNIQFKNIEEVPEDIFHRLYDKRPRNQKNIPYEEYKKFYGYIIVDNIIYTDKENEQRAKFGEGSSTYGLCTAEAVIKENKIIKNRYGYND